jgi:hypothetical protein
MKSEDLDDFFRRFKEAILKLAALKELEMMGPEKVESFIMKKTAENELKFILKE